MKVRLILAAAAVVAALAVAGTASAVVVDQDVATGNTPGFVLSSTRTTTAFAVGAWTFSPGPVTVTWYTDCIYPVNDRAGQVVLNPWPFNESAVVFTANRQVGTPWQGWDFCNITAFYEADFGTNPDASQIESAVAGWLVSHG